MNEKKVLVEISARHAHVTQADLETLFGVGAVLHVKKNLSQPGQYASEEKVDLVGPKS
ncbi:MAG: putative propanediol/ethanolamine utilization, partial [Erysipelotrichaceae bacterium]